MKGFEKYLEIFVSKIRELLADGDLKNNKEYQDGFREIANSYYCLLDIEIYIGRFPYNKTGISKTRHLSYHMENYLNEIYILRERLNAYLKKIGRLYKGDPSHETILKKIEPLFALVNKSLKDIIDTRCSHVHKIRFHSEDLDRLSSLELLSTLLSTHGNNELTFIKNFFNLEYRTIRRKFKIVIKNNNKQIKILLDACFDVLYEIVTDQQGNIKYPETIKA